MSTPIYPSCLINGENKPYHEISDRGFQYGDGLFETIEVENGVPVFLDRHIQRLVKGCKQLLLPLPDIECLKKEASQLSEGSQKAILKLIYTRGSGGRGYRQPDIIQPTRCFSLHSFPEYPENYNQYGIIARFCQTRLGLNPALAGIKHLNRLEQVVARSEWNCNNIQEGLMLDFNGNVIEGVMSNFFLVRDNVVYTPNLDLCGVKGVIRDILIYLARKNQIELLEKTIQRKELFLAEELFVTNSIIGIWPIKQIEDRYFKMGSLTKKFQALLLDFKKQENRHAS